MIARCGQVDLHNTLYCFVFYRSAPCSVCLLSFTLNQFVLLISGCIIIELQFRSPHGDSSPIRIRRTMRGHKARVKVFSEAHKGMDFVPHASMDTAHHMLLYGCRTPVSTKGYWDCGGEQGTCADEAKIMYAWARNAPPTKLPRDVGFKVGGDTGITHFVLQIHYGDVHAFRDHHRDCSGLTLRMTSIPQPFIAGMYLMMSVDTVIPPGKRVTNADIACSYSSYPMHPFAFRTHTHRLGQVVSGYRVRNGKWTLIGRQSPQLPQAFYTASNFVTVENGDMLAARCVFTGEGRTTKTRIGGTSQDEMCNFYIMYYMDSKHAVPYMDCMEHGSSRLFKDMPEEANVPVPVPPEFTMTGMRHGAGATDHQDDSALLEPKREEEQLLDQGDFYSLLSKLLGEREDVVHVHKYNPAEAERAKVDLVAEIDSIMQKKDSAWPSPRLAYNVRDKAILVRDRVHKFHQLESTVRPTGTKIMAMQLVLHHKISFNNETTGVHLGEVADWPEVPLQLGQVSGLALDSDGNLIIFHRGDHRWGLNSFDIQGRYQQRSFGPIQQSTILVVDPNKGSVFYLPHGISTDKDDNYWVTDVALHQVFKLGNKDRPVVVLGEAFEPGNDRNHFCKPTDVAVDPVTGNVFVSDGYCNSRIIVFSPEGKFITEWGAGIAYRRKRIPFSVPHSLVFLPDKRELCVADRENGRIQCFLAESGDFTKEIKKDEFGGKVFAVSYAPVHGGLMYAVNGRSGLSVPLQGFVVNYSTKEILDTFSPESQVGGFLPFIISLMKTPGPAQKSPDHHEQQQVQTGEKPKEKSVVRQTGQGVSPAIITTLLLIPLVVVLVVGVFIRWRKSRMYGGMGQCFSFDSNIGKAAGSLNLGNFFATHKGYTRQGFDRLSTEGSDQEKDDEDATDSENEEYSAPPPPVSSTS
uniref:Peptidylglycine alpha-amidating monooxygenase n=1 Tax=Denticeps clupeoides TaxID=299321 RepID=A0AAY4BZV3_9TELE